MCDYRVTLCSLLILRRVEGVIWTDVIQGIILLGGAVLVIILGAYHVGGFGQITQDALANGKIVTADKFSWSLTASTIPIIFIGSVFNSLQQYTASQDVVLRYSTTESVKETNKSIWTNGLLAFISIPIFYGMGTVLYSFYKGSHAVTKLPDFMNAEVGKAANTTALVPYFILTALPAGVAGLVIAYLSSGSINNRIKLKLNFWLVSQLILNNVLRIK